MGGARLGEVLVDAGLISSEQLSVALGRRREFRRHWVQLASVIAECGFATETAIAQALAEHLEVDYVDLAEAFPQPDAVQLVPRWLAERHHLVPLERTDAGLAVAMSDPTNLIALDDVRVVSGVGRIVRRVASAEAIQDALSRFYASDLASNDMLEFLDPAADPMSPEHDPPEDVASLHSSAQVAPIVHLVTWIFADAVRARATDVHIEPQSENLMIRYRVDGLLREATTLPHHVHAAAVSRIKIIGGMDIAERRRPQDGRIKVVVDGREVDARVSTMPTLLGEKVVIRLLSNDRQQIDLANVGLDEEQLSVLCEHLDMPQGLIIFTGPTGSGKTSTMYASLKHVHTPEKNTITLEDPIEYQIPGLNQVQINNKSGITFARGMRSILRQDPDVIMVGEIRDKETAEIVMQAALTGHLVLSSLHTNDAASAVPRLVDLGVEPFLIAAGLKLIVAQRLVRVACTHCAVPAKISDETLIRAGLVPSEAARWSLVQGVGCTRCGGSGYRGRTAIYELLPITAAFRDLIGANSSDAAIAAAAQATGHSGLRQSGLRRAKAGHTTLEEVIRVTDADHDPMPSCPSCLERIEPGFVLCPHCESDLGHRVCPGCGQEAAAGWKACPFCRTRLPATAPSDRPLILLIDSDPNHLSMAQGLFSATHDVVSAPTGAEGVRLALELRPELVILDLPAGDLDGGEIVRRLRSSPATRGVRTLALVDEGTSVEGGSVEVMSKPVDLIDLRERAYAVVDEGQAPPSGHQSGSHCGEPLTGWTRARNTDETPPP